MNEDAQESGDDADRRNEQKKQALFPRRQGEPARQEEVQAAERLAQAFAGHDQVPAHA